MTPTGPAEKAGIEPGDVVIEFNGKVNAMRDLPRIVADTPIGKKVPVKIFRKGRTLTLWRRSAGWRMARRSCRCRDSAGQAGQRTAVVTVLGMTVAR